MAECFGFYKGNPDSCASCAMRKKCKSVLITHGFDIVSDVIATALDELKDVSYIDTDRISEMVTQLLFGPDTIDPEGSNQADVAATLATVSEGLDLTSFSKELAYGTKFAT